MSNVGGLSGIACGAHHTLFCSSEGAMLGWGKNDKQQIMPGRPIIEIPALISIPVKVKSVAAGWSHSICASEDGRVFAWGTGEDGQLGLGDACVVEEPTEILESESEGIRALHVYAGHSHSGILDAKGHYYAFGFNLDYRLMVGGQKEVRRPVLVRLGGIVKAALGVSHSCLLTGEGRVYCGGVGTNGELGVDLDPTLTGYEEVVCAPKAGDPTYEKVCPLVEVEFFG